LNYYYFAVTDITINKVNGSSEMTVELLEQLRCYGNSSNAAGTIIYVK